MSISNEKLFNLYIVLKTTFNRIITPELQTKLESFNDFVDEYKITTERLRVDVGVLDFEVRTITTNIQRVRQDVQTLGPVLNNTVQQLQTTYDTSFEQLTETINTTLTDITTRMDTLERTVSNLHDQVMDLEYRG